MNKILTNKKTILVIEDDSHLLSIITEKLQGSGFAVISARSVDEVFTKELLTSRSSTVTTGDVAAVLNHVHHLTTIDAIWLDHNLIGNEDGLDLIVKFKANGGNWSRIPFFVVSNSANPDLIKTYAEIGVNHYYLKAEQKLETIVRDIITALESDPE